MKIPASTVRALSGHWLWCSAVGTPSVDITITNNDKVLVTSSGYALIRVYDEGTYTCTAKNQAGIDSKEIQVSLTASKNTLLINNPFLLESWAGWEWEGGNGGGVMGGNGGGNGGECTVSQILALILIYKKALPREKNVKNIMNPSAVSLSERRQHLHINDL